jgi:hypothetical protein
MKSKLHIKKIKTKVLPEDPGSGGNGGTCKPSL